MTRGTHGERTRVEICSLRVASITTAALAVIIAGFAIAPISGSVPGSDSLYHAIGFAALTAPLTIARPSWAPFLFLGACIYGAALELVQPLSGRTAEIGDFWADVAGAAAGCTVGWCIAWIGRTVRAGGHARDAR